MAAPPLGTHEPPPAAIAAAFAPYPPPKDVHAPLTSICVEVGDPEHVPPLYTLTDGAVHVIPAGEAHEHPSHEIGAVSAPRFAVTAVSHGASQAFGGSVPT